jgi:hypothetical protein
MKFCQFYRAAHVFLSPTPAFLNGILKTICQGVWFNNQRRVWPAK